MNKIIADLEKKMEKEIGKRKSKWDDNDKKAFDQRIKDIAETNFFGFDLNPDLVKATKMNMVMNNDGSGNIYQTDSLLPPHEWEAAFRKELAAALEVEPSALSRHNGIGFFDVIVTNPPFGSKIPIKDPHILEQYDLARIWERDKANRNNWTMTDRLQSSVPPEQLFVERCVQLLKPGGRLGIVLPDSILGAPGLGYIPQWLIRNTRLLASIDLHGDTFQPRNGTQTSVLLLQKKTPEEIHQEERSGKMMDYAIFMAMVDRIGHDKRGNPIFKRDKHGNEILVPTVDIITYDETANGESTAKIESNKKIIDDQTTFVAETFGKWRREEGVSW
jgi:type I restriction enzyme M protein